MHLKIVEKDFGALNADLYTDRPVEERANIYYWGWWPDYNDPSNFSWILFNSAAAPDQCPCYNSGYYHNDRVDEIINAGFSETDDAKLTESFKEAQDIMTRVDPPILPMGQQLDETYFRADIKGNYFNPLYILTWDYYALSRG
jgi:ABC-type transport system substrate-binding protein